MAIPTVQAVGSSAAGIGDITVTLPTHAADDILLVVHETNQSTAPSAPSGWAVLAQYAQGTNVTTVTVYWLRATSSGTTNPTFVDPGNHQIGAALVIRGCITSGNPWDYTPSGEGQSGTTTFATTSQTTTVNDCLVFGVISDNTDTATDQMSGEANANLSTFTKQGAFYTTQGNGGGVIVYTGGLATAGSTGSFTGNIATTSAWAGVTFALKPAAGVTNYNGTSALSATAVTTSSGVVGKVATSSIAGTASVTASGVVARAATAALSATGSITASGVVGKVATATITGTATVAASGGGTVEASSSIAATATTTATGQVAGTRTTAVSATATITATGQVGLVASATIAATNAVNTNPAVGLAGTAAIEATGTIVGTVHTDPLGAISGGTTPAAWEGQAPAGSLWGGSANGDRWSGGPGFQDILGGGA